MQLLFLFCTMLIIKSEAFCQKLRGDRRSTSFKRKTSRFPHRLKYPISRYMFSDLNVPLSVAPFTYEISQYEEPNFTPLRIKPYEYENYFPQRSNVNKRLRRHFLKNDCKFFTNSIYKPLRCFDIHQFPGSRFRHFRNLIDLQKVRNSKHNGLKRRRHQCSLHEYVPFNHKNSRFEPRKLIKNLKKKHKRFSNTKKQCLSDMNVKTESSASKTNATNISTTDEKNNTNAKSDNCVGEKLKSFSAYPKSNSLTPIPSKDSASVTVASHKLDYSGDQKSLDLSYFGSENPVPNIRKKQEISEINKECKSSIEENIAEGINKLKHMVNDVENAFREHKKKSVPHPVGGKASKGAKKNLAEKTGTNMTTEDMRLKEKIEGAIPILNQISEELSKRNRSLDCGSNTSTTSNTTGNAPTNETDKRMNERCNPDGTWLSSTMKMNLTFTVQPNMMIKVTVKPNKESLINGKWSLQGLTLSKRGGPFIFAGLYPQERKVVSFLGQCKISKEQDFIFGIWTLFRFSRKYTDLWKSVETKLDVLTKKNGKSEKRKKSEKKKKKTQKHEKVTKGRCR